MSLRLFSSLMLVFAAAVGAGTVLSADQRSDTTPQTLAEAPTTAIAETEQPASGNHASLSNNIRVILPSPYEVRTN